MLPPSLEPPDRLKQARSTVSRYASTPTSRLLVFQVQSRPAPQVLLVRDGGFAVPNRELVPHVLDWARQRPAGPRKPRRHQCALSCLPEVSLGPQTFHIRPCPAIPDFL